MQHSFRESLAGLIGILGSVTSGGVLHLIGMEVECPAIFGHWVGSSSGEVWFYQTWWWIQWGSSWDYEQIVHPTVRAPFPGCSVHREEGETNNSTYLKRPLSGLTDLI